MRVWLTIFALLIGCGSDGASTDGGGASTTEGTSSVPTSSSSSDSTHGDAGSTTTDGDVSTTVSPGDPCPLVGMFRECTADGAAGLAYCDDFDGARVFGPCLTEEPECGLVDPDTCMDVEDDFLIVECELVDGVPSWVPAGNCDVSTSG